MDSLVTKYGLSVYPYPVFESNGKSYTLGSELIILDGTPFTDHYIAFVTSDVDENDIVISCYAQGNTHADSTISIYMRRSTDYLATHPLVAYNSGKIFTNTDYPGYLTDPSCGYGYNGRIFAFATNVSASTNAICYCTYSDDGGNNFVAPFRIDLGSPVSTDYLIVVNPPIKYNGYLLMACHHAANATTTEYEGVLLRSDLNGVAGSWYRTGTIWATDNDHIHEPIIFSRPLDNLLYCFGRSDTPSNTSKARMWHSYDGGLTWPPKPQLRYLNDGSADGCVLPSGSIAAISRCQADGRRTRINFSNDGGQSFVTGYIDSRTGISVKGNCVYLSAINMVAAIYCTEIGTPQTGPTVLVRKFITEL